MKCITDDCSKRVHNQKRQMCKPCYEKFRRSQDGGRLSTKLGTINEISDLDAAYMAGMIDADGMITVSAQFIRKDKTINRASPMVVVTNTNMDLIEWFKVKVGAGTSYETKTEPRRIDQTRANWNKVHRYQITGLKAVSLIDVILPYLIVKKDRAILVCQIPLRGKGYTGGASAEQILESKDIVRKIRFMNARGRAKHDLFRPLQHEGCDAF